MKKVLQSVAVALTLLFATNAHAQLPNNGIYPGGLMLDSYQPSAGYTGNHIYDMGTWDIDSILDSGTPVILDLFATWCGPCWSYHTGGTLENLFDSQGWGGPGNVAIFGVESDPSTAASKLEGGDQGDWITNTKYPMVNHNTVANMFNLTYYPTIVMICPDRTVTEVGQTTEANFTTALNSCAAPASNVNDPRLLSVDAINANVCQQQTADVSISVTVQNYSTASISGAYDIEVTDASNAVIATTTANLNLAAYAVQSVTVGTVTANMGANTFTAKITTPNDDLSNDSQVIAVNVSGATDLLITPDMNVRVELSMDGYASEVGLAIREGIPTGDAATEWAAATAGNSIAYIAQGSMTNGTSSFAQDYTINNYGCHFLVTYDDYGDGITYNTPSANLKLISSTTDIISGNWDAGLVKAYDFKSTVGLDENSGMSSLSIYPNPAVSVANVTLNLNEEANVTISIVNTLGQNVYTNALGNVNGTQNVQINTTDLNEGIYLVNVTVNGNTTTQRISIVK
jgi:thiol-disulfide isomerase/thioredoxin